MATDSADMGDIAALLQAVDSGLSLDSPPTSPRLVADQTDQNTISNVYATPAIGTEPDPSRVANNEYDQGIISNPGQMAIEIISQSTSSLTKDQITISDAEEVLAVDAASDNVGLATATNHQGIASDGEHAAATTYFALNSSRLMNNGDDRDIINEGRKAVGMHTTPGRTRFTCDKVDESVVEENIGNPGTDDSRLTNGGADQGTISEGRETAVVDSVGGDELARRVQKLAQELQDAIFEFVATPSSDTVVIDENYMPPSSLAIDRVSRKKFADEYHANIFWIPAWSKHLIKWLRSIDKQYIYRIKEIRVGCLYHNFTSAMVEMNSVLCELERNAYEVGTDANGKFDMVEVFDPQRLRKVPVAIHVLDSTVSTSGPGAWLDQRILLG